MARWLYVAIVAMGGYSCPVHLLPQCGFAIVPAGEGHWVRSDGWQLPGLDDAKAVLPVTMKVDGQPNRLPDGMTVWFLKHTDGYRVLFPDAVFEEEGAHKRMLQRSFVLYQMLRWEMHGKTYAYSYELGPLDVACTASIDIIDDKGDGKFRLMTTPGHVLGRETTPPPVPGWLDKPKS